MYKYIYIHVYYHSSYRLLEKGENVHFFVLEIYLNVKYSTVIIPNKLKYQGGIFFVVVEKTEQ